MVQYEVAKVNLPPIPSALTLPGPVDPTLLNFPNSANFAVDGTDSTDASGNKCGPDKPAIGTVTDVGTATETALDVATDARNSIISALPRPQQYTGVDACTSNQPDVQNVTNTVDPAFSTIKGLQGVVQSVEGAATQTYGNNPSIPDLGTDANPKVTVVNGDLSLSGSTNGSGILLVTGTLTMGGNFSYNGLILVIGSGKLISNGGGNGQITGAVIVAKIGDNSGCGTTQGYPCYATNPTDSNLLTKLGSPTYDFSGGGGNGLKYNSCNIKFSATAGNYSVISRREITY
jgi:hypothetical protein